MISLVGHQSSSRWPCRFQQAQKIPARRGVRPFRAFLSGIGIPVRNGSRKTPEVKRAPQRTPEDHARHPPRSPNGSTVRSFLDLFAILLNGSTRPLLSGRGVGYPRPPRGNSERSAVMRALGAWLDACMCATSHGFRASELPQWRSIKRMPHERTGDDRLSPQPVRPLARAAPAAGDSGAMFPTSRRVNRAQRQRQPPARGDARNWPTRFTPRPWPRLDEGGCADSATAAVAAVLCLAPFRGLPLIACRWGGCGLGFSARRFHLGRHLRPACQAPRRRRPRLSSPRSAAPYRQATALFRALSPR